MLGKIRKFSNTITAKIFLVIVAIPFVFWGMGDLFSGGAKSTIVKIGKDKISVKEFVNYVNFYSSPKDEINSLFIEKMLSNFISKKIIEKEIESFNIILSDLSLSKLIKNEKTFKKENKFSRTEYEKFLVTNSLSAVQFEENVSNQIKKELLFDFISGGIIPSDFLVNTSFNKFNQKREIEVIKLNDLIKQKTNFSDTQIKDYFNKNKNEYKQVYKTIEFIEINPENLTGSKDFSDNFFAKIDKIDDLIVEGNKINFILKKFDLSSSKEISFDQYGRNKDDIKIDEFPLELVDNIFSRDESVYVALVVHENKYFVIQVNKTEEIQKKITDPNVKKNILMKLKRNEKRSFIAKLINDVTKNNFKKNDFYDFAKKQGIEIEKITLQSQFDNKVLKENLIKQVYSHPNNKVVVVADIGLTESYLIYIANVENKSVTKDSPEYNKYLNLSKVNMTASLYNTYDLYLKEKYKININYKALETVKNYIK